MGTSRREFGLMLASLATVSAVAQEAPSKPTLIYFGAMNCPVCRDWKRFELSKLKDSEVFKAARYVEISKEIPAPIPPADRFPQDLAPERDEIANGFDGKVGSPMFAIVVGKKVTWRYRGAPSAQTVIDALMKSTT